MSKVALEVHMCKARRSIVVRFANGDQAVDYIARNSDRFAFNELTDEFVSPHGGPVSEDVLRLLDVLYPHCEHGLSADLCEGPNHYQTYEQERASYGY